MSAGTPATPSVREARFQLAQALLAERSDREYESALELMRDALRDPGEHPSAASIHNAMADAHWVFHDWRPALSESLLSMIEEPASSDEAAGRARRILNSFPQVAAMMPDALVQDFERSIDGSGADGLWVLAGKIRLLRGDYEQATELLSRGSATVDLARAQLAKGQTAEALATLREWEGTDLARTPDFRLTLAQAHAENGDHEEALAALPEGDEAEHVFVRALGLLGNGEPEAALEALASRNDSADLGLLRVVALLTAKRYEDARREVSSAIADQAHSADAMLLRAQVELEWSVDLEQGRSVLERAHELMERDLVASRWVTLQLPFAGDRDRFQYFLTEAADVSGRDDALARAGDVNRGSTTYAQDGRLDTIRAERLARGGDLGAAAAAFDQAAKNYETALAGAGDASGTFDRAALAAHALDATRRAFELESNAERAGLLGRAYWQASFSGATKEENLDLLRQARDVLASGRFEESVEEAGTLVYYDGLVSRRIAELAPERRTSTGWRAVEELLGAALSDRGNAYRSLYLSEALGVVDAWDSAFAFAHAARALHEDDATKEALVIAEANYRADPETIGTLLDAGFENAEAYENWTSGVRAFVSLVNGELVRQGSSLSAESGYESWARQVAAQAVALAEGPQAARPLLEAVLEEHSSTPGEECDACYVALLLEEPAKAEEMIARGRTVDNVTEPSASWYEALVGLVTGDPQRRGEAERWVPELSTRVVKQALNVQVPLLGAVYGESEALDSLASVVEAEAQRRMEQTDPTIFDGLGRAPDDRRDAIRALATSFDALRGSGTAEEAMAALDAVPWEGRMARVVEGVRAGLDEGDTEE